MRCLALTLAMLGLSACGPGVPGSDPVEGFWNWETAIYNCSGQQCRLNGNMVVHPAENGRYPIELNAFQKNGYRPDGGYTSITSAEQQCTGVLDQHRFQISCRVIRAPTTYLPDNFDLSVSPDGMRGQLLSIDPVAVTFIR